MNRSYKLFYIGFIIFYSIVQYLIGRLSVSSIILVIFRLDLQTMMTYKTEFFCCSSLFSISQLKKEMTSTLYFYIFLYTVSIYFIQFEVSEYRSWWMFAIDTVLSFPNTVLLESQKSQCKQFYELYFN